MNITISVSTSVNLEEQLSITEDTVNNILERVVRYILNDGTVKAEIKTLDINLDTYEEIEIDFYFTDNSEIQQLNKEYRNIDAPTDVLSFVAQEIPEIPDIPFLHLGEIVISVDQLKAQAQKQGHSIMQELIFLSSHGVLHLSALHHDTDESYNRNIEIQTRTVHAVLSNFK